MQPLADTASFSFTITTSFVCPYFLFLNLGCLPVFPDRVCEAPLFHWCLLEWCQLLVMSISHSPVPLCRYPKTETRYIKINGFSLHRLYHFLHKCKTAPSVRKGVKEVWGPNTDERHSLPTPWSQSQGLNPLVWMCSPAKGQAVTLTLHKEVPWIHSDLRSLQHLCQGAFSCRDYKSAWALLWCSKGLDSGTCWAPAASLSSLGNAGFS